MATATRHPRTTGKSRRLERQRRADRGQRGPGDPIVLVPANQAAEAAARRPRPHRAAADELLARFRAAHRRPRTRTAGFTAPGA